MNKLLTKLHRWVGFPVGILFVITFATGFLTSIDELAIRFNQSMTVAPQSNLTLETAELYRPLSLQENAEALATITTKNKGVTRISLPSEQTPYYQLESKTDQWLYSLNPPYIESHITIENDGFFRTVLQLHRNFLLGKEGFLSIQGKHYAAWVGLIAVILSLIGLWLWWPKRRLFNIKDIFPRGKKRKNLYGNHTSAGVISVLAIVILGLSGASITYKDVAKNLLGVDVIKNSKPTTTTAKKVNNQSANKIENSNNWGNWLQTAYQQMPEGSVLTEIRYPRNKRQKEQSNNDKSIIKVKKEQTAKVLTFKFITPDSWLGLAHSSVSINTKTAAVDKVTLFNDFTTGEKIYALLKPLHTGHGLPLFYVFIQFMFGLIGSIMVATGVIMFITKQRRKK
ncbi:PepSY-associated TM helix domain-containing protein [Colwellia echini]|uniref:PepSY domain-containing protein n=1 Tax=Colwellia echini TaxID=1982103 RepID=A0ABY3MUU8_9GAMM|nr:PepSY-associated TM helix domain-containing protein [Colwellia echini]TYK64988.1 PepSY domain-containing protein [Colwellia echini]